MAENNEVTPVFQASVAAMSYAICIGYAQNTAADNDADVKVRFGPL
jgi:hypothetical protein